MSDSLRLAGKKSDEMYHALVKVIKERSREDRESRAIHEFVKGLSDRECRNFVEDALQHFRESEDAKEYGNVMIRSLHMYGYEVYPRLKAWRS